MVRLSDMGKVSVDADVNVDDSILRYMNYQQFKELFHTGLKLTKASKYAQDDPFEGEFIDLVYQIAQDCKISIERNGRKTYQIDSLKEEGRKVREKSYVSCWTLSKRENVALWKIYGKDKNSIALKSTIFLLKQEFDAFLQASKGNDAVLKKLSKHQIVKVKYIDHRTKELEVFERFCKMHPSEILHYKNIAYEYEAEVRVIFDGVGLNDTEPTMISETYTIGINPQVFATEIVVSPFADDWFYDLVQHEMEEFDMAALVQWSSLKFKPSDCRTAQTVGVMSEESGK
jgi:hypothetical protein